MKKKLALILCVMLCMTAFAGCSSAEIGYLNLSKELLAMDSMQQTGSMEVYCDADALKAYVTDQAVKNKWASKEEVDELFTGFTGTKNFTVDYTGNLELNNNNMRFVYDFTVTVDRTKMPIGKMYFSMTDGVYVDKDVLWNTYQLAEKVIPGYSSDAVYKEAMKAALAGNPYVELVSAEDMMATQVTGVTMPTITDYNAIYDSAFKFLMDGFKDYSTNAVTEVPGGYSVSVTGESMLKLVSDLLDYTIKDFDTIAPAYMAYCKTIAELMNLDVQGAFDQPIDAKTKGMLVGMLTTVQTSFAEMIKEGTFDVVKPFSYKETIKKSGDTYISDSNFAMTVNGKQIAYLKTAAKTSKATATVTYPTTGTSLDQIMENAEKVNSKYNPVKSVLLSWDSSIPTNSDEFTVCDVTYNRDKNLIFSSKTSYDVLEYISIDDAMYLPLRSICESLGEEVGWDNTEKQAYITKGGVKTVMTGVVDGDETFVKMRDFEKLGYTVTYDGSTPGLDKATIIRK